MSGFIAGCGVQPNAAQSVVLQQYNFLQGYIQSTLNSSIKLAEDIGLIQIPNLAFSVDITAPQQYSLRDTISVLPTLQDVKLATLPGLPSDPGYDNILPPVKPLLTATDPGTAPAPIIDPTPAIYQPSFGPEPTLFFPTIPTYGDLTSGVPFPDLLGITLPTPPTVNIDAIQFLGTPPVFTAQDIDAADFAYVDPGYTPLLITDIKPVLESMLGGTSGLPAFVENAIWAREADREDGESMRAEQEVREDWAMRGQTLPGGVIDSKLMQVRQNSQNKRVSLGRDVMINIHKVLIDQLNQAIVQGIALENVWVNIYNAQQERQLQAARMAIDIAIAVYNAKVAKYRADADVFGIFAQVYKDQIEAELAKVQVYSEEIKAQALIEQINQDMVAIYTARLNAIKINVDVYLANIQAYTSQVQAQELILKAYQTSIEIEKSKLEASKLELEGWQTTIQGQQLIQEAWKTRIQAYAESVRAFVTEYEAEIERYKGDIQKMDAVTARFVGLLKGFDTIANYQRSIADVAIASNTSKVQAFTAQVSADSSYNQALVGKMKAIADSFRDATELALKNGEINVQSAIETVRLIEQAKTVAVQALTQIAGGLTSATSAHAGISDSTSAGYSCSTSLSETFSAN